MTCALLVILVHIPSGNMSTETIEFETQQLCESAVASLRYPTTNGFRMISTCMRTSK